MLRKSQLAVIVTMLLAVAASAEVPPKAAQQLYERVTPSLVAVQYVWQYELGRRELIGAGAIVSDEGLVMCPLPMFGVNFPDEQMKEFKVIVPKEDGEPQELDAIFQGRD